MIGEVPVALTVNKVTSLIGSNPTGLIGMSGFIRLMVPIRQIKWYGKEGIKK